MIQVTGHRGARDLAPENTIAGFQLAYDLGCHGVEFDVQLTRDGVLAVIHDSDINRTTDGSGPVSGYSMGELKNFDAGNGETIPSMEEVIEFLAPTDLILQIELKGSGTAVPAAELIKAAGLARRVRFTSFFHTRVYEAKKHLPEAETGILINSNPANPIHMLEDTGADCLHVKHSRLDRRLVDAVQQGGKKCIAMGVIVEPDVIDSVIALGVDVIGSDRPDLVIQRLKDAGLYRKP